MQAFKPRLQGFLPVPKAAGAGQYALPGFDGVTVPRSQSVTIVQAMALRDRAVRLPARGDGGFKRAAREVDARSQGALEL